MQSLTDIRQKYPQYSDMSDQDFADRFHQKFYADIPKEEFYQRIGFNQEPQSFMEKLWPQMKPMPQNYTNSPELRHHLEELTNLAAGSPGTKLIGQAFNAVKPVTKKSMVESIWKPHDTLSDKATAGFQDVLSKVMNRNVPNVTLAQHNINIAQLQDYLPNTKRVKNLLQSANQGDYKALRDLQSELFHQGKTRSKSIKPSDRNEAEEIFEKRDMINQAIADNLRNTGNVDLADQLGVAIGDFKNLQNIYYNPKLPAALKKLVDKETREIPKNLSGILSKESKPMEIFMGHHPELKPLVKKYGLQNEISKYLLKYGLPGGLAGSAASLGYNYFKH